MAKVELVQGTKNVTPWGQTCHARRPFQCDDEAQLKYFRINSRYAVGETARPPIRAVRVRKPEAAPAPATPERVPPVQESPAPVADLGVLDNSVKRLESALASGDYDQVLEELLEAEESGKTRKSALRAIEDRKQALLNG